MTYDIEKRKAGRQPLTIVELDLDTCANKYSQTRTNLIPKPEALDDAAWSKNACSVTANAIVAPDGKLTMDSIVEDSTTAAHFVNDAISKASSAIRYVGSAVFKEGLEKQCTLRWQGNFPARVDLVVDLDTGLVSSTMRIASR